MKRIIFLIVALVGFCGLQAQSELAARIMANGTVRVELLPDGGMTGTVDTLIVRDTAVYRIRAKINVTQMSREQIQKEIAREQAEIDAIDADRRERNVKIRRLEKMLPAE